MSSQMAGSAERVARLLAGTEIKVRPLVIYSGDERQNRKSVHYLPWDKIELNSS